jgi:hypothetical protein
MNCSALKSIIFLNSEVNIGSGFHCASTGSSLKSAIIHKSALPTSHPCTSNVVDALSKYYTIISQEEVNSEYVKLIVEEINYNDGSSIFGYLFDDSYDEDDEDASIDSFFGED